MYSFYKSNSMRFFLLFISFILASEMDAQVHLQTGSAHYSIPIFTFSDAKSNLSTQVKLSYSSGSGLIVSDIASNTGQNWNLLAGGSITRKQRGEPDDQNSTTQFPVMPAYSTRGFNNSTAN